MAGAAPGARPEGPTGLKQLKLPNGYSVRIVPGSEPIVHEIWRGNYYCRDAAISEGSTVLDLGANQGLFSLQAAHKGAHVESYEPLASSFDVLAQNVAQNALGSRVKMYQEAVGARDEERVLFVPTSPNLVPTGSVTMIAPVLDMLSDLVSPSVSSMSVKCVTLKTVFERVLPRRVDLLKIDCEGAELEILQSAPREYFRHVDAVSMETHDAYPERELFELLQYLGFRVHTYEKRNGAFRIGYAFASRDPNREVRRQPVAILSAPTSVLAGEPLVLDGSSSFVTRSGEALRRRWALNDVALPEQGTAAVRTVLAQPGQYRLRLVAVQGDETDEAACDVLCLKSDYFSQSVEHDLAKPRSCWKGQPAGRVGFKIPHQSVPAFWSAKFLVVAVETPGSQGEISGHFEFNGTRQELAAGVNRFKIELLPPGLDICFSLTAPASPELSVSWWLESSDAKPVEDVQLPNAERVVLAPLGDRGLTRQRGRRIYLIPRTMLPETWPVFGIGISVAPGEATARAALTGTILVPGAKQALEGWYTEVRFPIPNDDETIEIAVDTLDATRDLVIIWWANG
jgi:FkbM family methyltransferase